MKGGRLLHTDRGVLDPYQGIRRNHVHTFVGPTSIFFIPNAPCVITNGADPSLPRCM